MKLTDKPFSLSSRIAGSYAETGDDAICDIEYRSEDQKFTVASDVPDEIAPLFIAAPTMLEACEAFNAWSTGHDSDAMSADKLEAVAELISAAIALATA